MIVMIGNPRLDGKYRNIDYVDNDCNGTTGDGLLTIYYPDSDNDGYGDGTPTGLCALTAGYVTNSNDYDVLSHSLGREIPKHVMRR